MMSWSMSLGLNSCSSIGFRSSVAGLPNEKKKTCGKPKVRKVPLKVSDEEVRELRRIHDAGGYTVREIHEAHCKDKITLAYLQNILAYTVRAKASLM